MEKKQMNRETLWGEFCKVMGATPRNRILEFFLAMRSLDYSIGDLALETQLPRATAYNTMEELIKEEYLVSSRKVSGSQLYKLNRNKREVKLLIAIFDMILDKIAQEYTPQPLIKQKKELTQTA